MSIDLNENKGFKNQSKIYKEKIMQENYTLNDIMSGRITLEEIENIISNESTMKKSYVTEDFSSREEVFDWLDSCDDEEECFFDDVETFLSESIEQRALKQKKLLKKAEKLEKEINLLYNLLEEYASEE